MSRLVMGASHPVISTHNPGGGVLSLRAYGDGISSLIMKHLGCGAIP